MLDFVERLAEVSGLPVGVKSAVGEVQFWKDLAHQMVTTNRGFTIAKVELSTDGGSTWTNARFTSQARPYCWRLWKADVDVLPQTTQVTVRAVDSTGNVQPRAVDWNLKGYQFNAWHKTPVRPSP